ncbi:helix-turn-helix domain-containing protein [Singulisphaera sp. PoT]|uniref:helix-turn-helix domain-containing protein n=1 Tax=Singulisphaera sp. PoT TaxID=3411797 RepID=UPI003BF54A82
MDAEKASPLQRKLMAQMLRRGLNGQKLAKISKVSDSEISRILAGKSRPGLENAFRLARAVGVSLDYLADDTLEHDPARSTDPLSTEEREVLELARGIGCSRAVRILENIRIVGYEVAMRRLLDAKPSVEPEEVSRPAPTPPVPVVPAVTATRIG